MVLITEELIDQCIRSVNQFGDKGVELLMNEMKHQQPVLFSFSLAASQFKNQSNLERQQELFTIIAWLSFYRAAGAPKQIEQKDIEKVEEMIMERMQLHSGEVKDNSFSIEEIFGYYRQQHLLNFLKDEMELLRNEGFDDEDVNQVLNTQLIIIYLLDEAANGETTLLN